MAAFKDKKNGSWYPFGGHARRRAQPRHVRRAGAGRVPLSSSCDLSSRRRKANPVVETLQGSIFGGDGQGDDSAGQHEQEVGFQNNSIEGWTAFPNPRIFAKYGRQRGWERAASGNEQAATGSDLPDGFRELTEEEARQMKLPF